jgi:S-adenosylmethionine hydrolase
MANRPVVTLLTDFGHHDPFVGAMKGVILGICPDATLVDLTHDVAPYDIAAGSFLLETAVAYFPSGTVHLAVIDPGVGGVRRPIAAQVGDQRFVAPDNGLLTGLLGRGRPEAVHVLAEPAYRLHPVSQSFHGRDIFAPAAGHLAAGLPIERLGPAVTDPVRLAMPAPQPGREGELIGRVIWVDHFGNCITDLPAAALDARPGDGAPRLLLDGAPDRVFPVVTSYEAAGPGGEAALVGSSGHLELFASQGSLAARHAVAPGRKVRLLLR